VRWRIRSSFRRPGSEDALVDAIAAATVGDAPLHLGPGVHLTKPGRRNLIPIGTHGLSVAAQLGYRSLRK
jgi:hypothetical protein